MRKARVVKAGRNRIQYNAAVERRRSNAATPIPSGKQYRRHPKHRNPPTED